MKVLIFGGTTEGRKLSQLLHKNGIEVVLFVATDYGKSLIEENITVYSKRLDEQEMKKYISENSFDYVLDTTHPYADIATKNIKNACENTSYIRLIRKQSAQNDDISYVPTAQAAVQMLINTKGNIFLTTGSKQLELFAEIENYRERIHVRIIPMLESLEKATQLGYKNIICMQGPFDFDLNKCMLLKSKAVYMVTKDSGDAGGFSEKVQAAQSIGCKVIAISRPTHETGLTYEEILSFFKIDDSIYLSNNTIKAENNFANGARKMFPLFFDLTLKTIIVIGGGRIAERRIVKLLQFGANIIVVSPHLTEHLQKLAEEQKINYINEKFKQEHLEKQALFLVIAATDDRTVNNCVMQSAKALGIFHIISDCKTECDTYLPAIVQSDSFILGLISKCGNHEEVKRVAQNLRCILNGE